MKLHEMKSTPGSRKSSKRVGRGTGSGWGKTAGRGENGQKSRSGFKNKAGFEGGQNPLYRRIPKRGFTNINTVSYSVVNIDKLNKLGLDTITPEVLIENRVLKNSYGKLKILGQGTLSMAITVSAHKFSDTAVKAIEAAGGKVISLDGEVTKPTKETKVKAKAEPKVEKVEEKEASADISSMKVAELRDLAKSKGIKGISTMKKDELIEAIKNA